MGYFFSSYPCGVKYANRDDIALVYADAPCNCIVLATRNRVKAAPVLLSLDRKNNPVRAILVNSGNANACTGEQGLRDITALTDETARLLEIDPLSVLAASTGVIGVPLPVNRMMNALPHLTANLAQDTVDGFSRAIMTTDTVPKVVSESFTTSRSTYTITAVSKGSGMIAPDMATLLSFVLCDAPISRIDMDSCFRKAVEISLNSITIDGDMSTNDSAFLLCPADGSYLSAPEDIASFMEALTAVLVRTAQLLVDDGEGTTKCVTVFVTGARTETEARNAAKSVAESLLVKTALFGNDPNWGRIACAAGYSGAVFHPEELSVSIGSQELFKRGTICDYNKEALSAEMAGRSYEITVDLGAGDFSWKYITSDISYDYVKINAEYTS